MKRYAANEGDVELKHRITITLSYLVSVVLSYSVMLCVMSYNLGIFMSIITGLTLGNFVFSYLKQKQAQNLDYFTTDYNAPAEKKPLIKRQLSTNADENEKCCE